MTLQLNPAPETYKSFPEEGTERLIDLMPKLIAEKRVPLSVSELMETRLKYGKNLSDWMDNYFDTGDGVVYHPDGRMKVVLDSQHLRDMTPESQRNGGALVLTKDDYKTLEGEEFKKGNLGKIDNSISRKDVKDHPVWKALARDQGLLNDYTDYIFREYQERFSKGTPLDDLKLMGIFLGSANGDTPEMRAWYVNRLYNGSSAFGRGNLDNDNGRFVGVSTRGAEVSKK